MTAGTFGAWRAARAAMSASRAMSAPHTPAYAWASANETYSDGEE
jgi:hypothetical protein